MRVQDITKEELERAAKSIISIESATQMTKRHVRQKIEEFFNLNENALYERKNEINEIIGDVLTNLIEEKQNKKNENENENKLVVKEDIMNNVKNSNVEENKSILKMTSENVEQVIENNVLNTKMENNVNDTSECSKSDSNDKPNSKKRKLNVNESQSTTKKQANIMTKDYFLSNAITLNLKIGDELKLKLEPRMFSTGSCGWHITDKIPLLVGEHEVLCQLCINCSGIRKKE
ncbi:conserved protein, unknown function [Hepatocystis sp. ex Piliocolobus tephrosceles]|nr:conserved protein, unknown function [Hepatocystis sp. ex Piliocolobus tephrosceles]